MDDVISLDNEGEEIIPLEKESVIHSCVSPKKIIPKQKLGSMNSKYIAKRLKFRLVPRNVMDIYKNPSVGEKRKNIERCESESTLSDDIDVVCVYDVEDRETISLSKKKKLDTQVVEPDIINIDSEENDAASEEIDVETLDEELFHPITPIVKKSANVPETSGHYTNNDSDSDVIIIEDELPDSNARIPYDDYDFVNDPYLPESKVAAKAPKIEPCHKSTVKDNQSKNQSSLFVMIPSEKVNFRGSCFARGDIVSVVDIENQVFFAQIRGFLENQFGDKSAVITWLLPSENSPKDEFDAATYIVGPEEDVPCKLEFLEFVCHAPIEYKMGSHSEFLEKQVCGYLMTPKGPKLVPLPVHSSSDSE